MTPTIPHQALYRRWRAQTFSQIVGQEAVVETLRNAVRTERVSHALLFVGPRGTGKTSLARILAKAVNCTNLQDGDPCDACEACVAIREGTTLDVLEIDAASNRGINEVRELRDRLAYPPGHLRRKIYILDEAHQITRDAWNALLKSLEEPPDFVIFMFASTEPSGFPPAILSRLQRFDVRRLTVPEIEGKLTRILEADGRTIEPGALTLIARLAAGGMRDAESILDQLLSMTADVITEAAVRDLLGLADAAAVDGFVEALLTGDAAAGIEILDRLEERGRDPRALLDQVVEAVRSRLVTEAASGGTDRSASLTAVARRLIAIDPDRAGIGGLRLQLELALFAGLGTGAAESPARPAIAPPEYAKPSTKPAMGPASQP
ncbi:MAG TPA: DNA polymerase III subunit gamma/tau, partial [Actinomycetota bacterium]|nr:DNA polymerase III subunit gamma/tau [Actinomycetota bacterium]